MAVLKGQGAMTGVNLIARAYNNGVTKNGKTQYLDVQVDHRDQRGPGQKNLHLVSQQVQDADGNKRYNNSAPYSTGQIEEIAKAAGDNVTPIKNKEGETIGQAYAVKANLMSSSKGNGLVLNTKTLEKSDFTIDSKTMDAQFASMKDAQKASAAEATAEVVSDVPTPETEAEILDAEIVEEPAVG